MFEFDFEDEVKFRKISLGILVLILLVSILSLGVSIFKKGNMFSQPDYMAEKMVPLDVCYFGMKGLASKKPNKELFSKEIYNGIKQARMNPLDLDDVREVGKARPVENNKLNCYVSVKDAVGTRSFEIELVETETPLGYEIKAVTEVAKLEDQE